MLFISNHGCQVHFTNLLTDLDKFTLFFFYVTFEFDCTLTCDQVSLFFVAGRKKKKDA